MRDHQGKRFETLNGELQWVAIAVKLKYSVAELSCPGDGIEPEEELSSWEVRGQDHAARSSTTIEPVEITWRSGNRLADGSRQADPFVQAAFIVFAIPKAIKRLLFRSPSLVKKTIG